MIGATQLQKSTLLVQEVISTQFICLYLTSNPPTLAFAVHGHFSSSLVSATAFLILVETELYDHATCTFTTRATTHTSVSRHSHFQASSCCSSAKYHTLFSSRTSSMRSFFAQKERKSVYKFILDCLDMINA